MKITERMMKLMKTNAVRGLAVVALAGAMFTAAAPKAEAQRFVVGVAVRGPVFLPAPPVRVYGGPVYAAPYGYYGDRRFGHDDWRFRHDHGWR